MNIQLKVYWTNKLEEGNDQLVPFSQLHSYLPLLIGVSGFSTFVQYFP